MNDDLNIPEQQEPEFAQPQYIEQVQTVPVKKPVNKLAIIIPCAFIVVAAVIMYIFMNTIGNRYEMAERNFFNSLSAGISNAAAVGTTPTKVTIGASLESEFADVLGASGFSIAADSVANGDKFYQEAVFSVNEKSALSLKAWYDEAVDELILSCPEMTEIMVVVRNLMSGTDTTNADYSEITDEILAKYFEIIGMPTIEKNGTFTVGGKTFNADYADVALHQDELLALYETALLSIKSHPHFIEAGYITEEQLEEELAALAEKKAEADPEIEVVKMRSFMLNGEICGREIEIIDDYESTTIKIYNYIDGEQFAYALSVPDMEMTAVGTIAGDVINGSAKIKLDDSELITLDLFNVTVSESTCKGNINLIIPSTALTLSMELSQDGDAKILSASLAGIANLIVRVEPGEAVYEDAPAIDENRDAIYDNQSEEDLNEFSERLNNFVTEISAKFAA